MQAIINILRRPYWITEAGLALYLFIFIILTGPRFSQLATMIGALSFLAFGAEMLRRGEINRVIQSSKPLIPFVLFVVLSICVLPLIPYAQSRVWNNFTGLIFIFLVFTLCRRYGRLPILENTFLLIIFLMAFLSVLAPGMLGGDGAAAGGGERLRYSAGGVGGDEHGTGASSISMYVGIASFIGLRLLFANGGFFRKWLTLHTLFIVVTLFLGAYMIIFFSGSRQGLIWLFIAAMFVGVNIFRKNLFVATLLSVPGALMLGLVAFFLFRETGVVQRFVRIFDPVDRAFDPEKSFEGRVVMIQRGFDLWKRSPLWGNGNEAFRVYGGHDTYSHNNYIELLVNYGVLGLVFFYLPMSIALFCCLQQLMSRKSQNLRLRQSYMWATFALFAIMVSHMFLPSYYMRPMLVFMGLVLGYFYFINDRRKSPQAEQADPMPSSPLMPRPYPGHSGRRHVRPAH